MFDFVSQQNSTFLDDHKNEQKKIYQIAICLIASILFGHSVVWSDSRGMLWRNILLDALPEDRLRPASLRRRACFSQSASIEMPLNVLPAAHTHWTHTHGLATTCNLAHTHAFVFEFRVYTFLEIIESKMFQCACLNIELLNDCSN